MSEKQINLSIVTPDQTVVSLPVDSMGAMGSEGAFTALPGHTPFLTDLQPGLMWYRVGSEMRELAVSGGFIEVMPDHVSVLADSAEYVEDIDIERAEASLKKAEELLAQAKLNATQTEDVQKREITQASASMARATTRLKIAARRIR